MYAQNALIYFNRRDTMKQCCKETYRLTIEEVILHIKGLRGVPIEAILRGLEHAVELLKEREPQQINHNEWKIRNKE